MFAGKSRLIYLLINIEPPEVLQSVQWTQNSTTFFYPAEARWTLLPIGSISHFSPPITGRETYYAPKLKKRTALFEKLREVFRQHVSWPVETVIAKINPILRGWVNYFRVGHSSICFALVKRWVEEKVRRHLMRARGRKGFGWTRWSSEWLYDRLGLFNNYQLRRWSGAKVAPTR